MANRYQVNQVSLVIFFLFMSLRLVAQPKEVLIYGSLFPQTEQLKNKMEERGFRPVVLTKDDLLNLRIEQGRLLLLVANTFCPPASRLPIANYLSKGGNIIVIGPKAFDYSPMPSNPVSIIDFNKPNQYEVVKPLRNPRLGSMEQPKVQTVALPSGADVGLQLATTERGMPDAMVQFSIKENAAASRSILTFQAKGNHYMNLLFLEIKDIDEKKWLSFVPLSTEWETYTLTFADFIPENWYDPHTMYPLLDPSKVDSLSMGANLMTVWKEKPMELSIGNVALAENKLNVYAPSSAISMLRLPFQENKTMAPSWIVDPFFRSGKLTKGAKLQSLPDSPFQSVLLNNRYDAVVLPEAVVEFPGSLTGTDTKLAYDKRDDREKRTIPILATEDGDIVARLDIHAGGRFANASIASYGLQPDVLLNEAQLLNSLVEVADFILNKTKIVKIQVNTTTQQDTESLTPRFTITIFNPTMQSIAGTLLMDVDGMPQKKVIISVPEQQSAERVIKLTEVPANFSFKNYNWKLSFTTEKNQDVIHDSVNLERSMLLAFIHLVKAQKKYPDGRYSHHYFGDAYGVRAMFAYLDFLKRNPDRLSKNQDLWKIISPADIEKSALWFCDMLVERQTAEGALPMGYSEHARGYNVADGGQMALALAQLSRYVNDVERKDAYLNVCYRFTDWAETFYIDRAKSDSLKVSQPAEYEKGNAKGGLYGLGLSGKRRIETGPSWVLSDILGVQIYLAYLDSDENSDRYKYIADRNVSYYTKARYSAAGYYQAEALFWAWLTTQDNSIRKVIEDNLRTSFLPALYKGKPNDMYDIGSRSTLRALPLLYYQQFIENTASNRAVLLKYSWNFASNSSQSSILNLSRTFPKPVHGESLAATKYAALSSLWAMELIEPGSTLFETVNPKLNKQLN